jgi:hypothetical protein
VIPRAFRPLPANIGPSGDEVVMGPLNIGFTFRYYCTDYTQFYISTNGFISLGPVNPGSGCCSGQFLPNAFAPNNVIAAGWEDLVTCVATRYETQGVAPNRVLVVEFPQFRYFGCGTCGYRFQIMLYEGSNKIEIHSDIPNIDPCNTLSTQGIEDATGTNATPVPGRNQAAWAATDARCFQPQGNAELVIRNTTNGFIARNVTNATDPNPPLGNSTYELLAINPCATCTTTVSVPYSVNPRPTVTINPASVSRCATDPPTQLTASGATTYAWSPAAGLSNPTIANPTANPVATTTYTVTGTDANGCTNTATVVVTVNPGATITVNPTSVTRCASDPPSQLTASGGNTYTWSPAAGLSNPTIANPTANPATTTIYTVTGTNANGCTGTATVTVTVNPTPNVTVNPTNVTRCLNDAPTQLTAAGAVAYSWAPAAGLSNATIANPTANPAATTTYTVTGTDANGCQGQATVTVTVNNNPTVTVNPMSASKCLADPAIQLTAAGAVNYTWTPAAGLSATNIPNPTASPTITTTYTVTGTDANGCTGTASTMITVFPTPPIPTVLTNTNPVCPDQRGAIYSVISTPGNTYTWTVPAQATLMTGQGTDQITVDWTAGGVPTPPGSYTISVTQTSANGCISPALNINVTVQNPPPAQPVNPTGTTPVCIRGTGTYSVTNDPTATNYIWSGIPNGAFISSGFGTNQVTINWGIAPVGTYQLQVIAANNCGQSPPNFITVDVIDVRPQPSVITPPPTLCIGQTATYSVTNDPLATDYTWTNTCGWANNGSTTNTIDYTPNTNGPCVITVVANNQCGSSLPRSITVFPSDVPSQPLPISGIITVCPNQVETYSVPAVNGVTYTWSALPAGATYVSGQGTNTVRINWGTATPQVYSLTVTPSNACGNGTAQSLDINIIDRPGTPDAILGPTPLCQGQAGTYSIQTPVQGVTYQWSVVPAGPTVSPSGSSATVVFPTAGTFTISVIATNQCGSSLEQIMVVNVSAPTTIVTTPLVTSCTPTTSLTATPFGGTWACVSCTGGASIDNNGNVSGMNNPGGTYVFSYSVNGFPCSNQQAFVTVRYDAAVGGTVSSSQTICSGGTGSVSLSGQSGNIVRWERSTDCVAYSPINNTSNTLTFINLTQTTCFRAVVQRGNCPPVNSSNVQITVIQRVTPTATPATQTVCGPTATVTGNLPPGTTGSWSFISGPQVASIVTAGVNGNISGMTVPGTYIFRWTLNNPPCPPVTADVTVTRAPALTVPNAGNDQTICSDRTTLVGNVPVNGTGSWSYVSGSPIPTITNIGQNVAVVSGMGVGFYVFRYTITSPNCGSLTDDVTVTREPAPSTANAGLDQTTCNNFATVQGNIPPITGIGTWSFVTGPTPAAITQSANIGNITGMTVPGQYCFRYTITNAPCPPSTDDVCITVTPQPSPAQVSVTTYNICDQTSATVRAIQPQHGTGTWSFVSGPGGTPTVVTQGTDGLITGLTAVGSYVFRWTVGGTGCSGSTSVDVTVNREVAITDNISAGPNQTLCNVTTTTLNSPTPIPPRSVGQWVYVSGPTPNVTVTTSGTTGNVINMDMPGMYVFEWRVRRQTGSCPPVTASIIVEIKPNPTTANAGADQTICGTTATLVGNIPQVGTGAWTQVSGPASTIVANNNIAQISGMNQNATYCYRWTIANAPCTPSTDDVCINVSNNPIGGTVTGDATVCTGTNSTLLTLVGHSGTIIRWEFSTNNFGTFTPIANTSPTYTATNLTQTTSYRAVLKNGTCPEVVSGFATVTVSQLPTVANAGADRNFCGSITTTTLAGNVPQNGTPSWTQISGPMNPSLTVNGVNLTVSGATMPGTYCFRYTISNPPCTPSTDDVCLIVDPQSNAGTTTAPATVCSGINNGTLTVTGFTGTIQRWETSTDNQNWSVIGVTTNTLAYNNLTRTTWYRPVVKSGSCPEAVGNAVAITVATAPGVANAGVDQSFCGNVTTAQVIGNTPQAGTGTWSFVAGPMGSSPSITTNGTVGDIVNMTLDGTYVFRWTINNPPCPPVFDDVAITRFTQTIPGVLSSSATVCSGSNSGTLTLSGYNGNILRWEMSNDNFVTTITSLNTTPNQAYSGLTQTTQFRAVVKAGACAEAVSNAVQIFVVPQTSPANGGPNRVVCGPDVTLTAQIPSQGTGTWSFVTGPSPVNITQIGNQLNVTGMASVGTYTFRWRVDNPPCQPTTADVVVSRLPDAPVANAGSDVTTCSNTLTLTGSNPGAGTPNWSQVSGPSVSLVNSGNQAILTGLTPGTYVFRYTVTQSPCPPSTDDVIVTVVEQPSQAQVTNQNVIVCDASTATLSALPPQVGTGVWSVVSGGASITNPNSPNTQVTGINSNGTYVFRWTVTNPPCNVVNTVDVVVTRQNGLGVNAFAGADQFVCNNQFALVVGNNPPLNSTGSWSFVSGPAPASITTVGNFGSITQMTVPGTYQFAWTITPTNGCPPSSSIVSVTRVAPPTTAQAGPVQTICGNSATVTGNVPVHGTGTWTLVSSPNGSNPNLNISGTTLTIDNMNVTGTYVVRWAIANPPCLTSAVDVPITVFEPTTAGTLQGENTVCSGNNSGSLTLTGHQGSVARWEVSTDAFNSFTIVNNTSPNLPYNNLTRNTCYRAIVKNGTCPEATSNIVCITVVPPVTTADAGADQSICADNVTLTGNVPMSGMPMWSLVSAPNGATPLVTNTQNVAVVTGMTVAGNYLFRYRIDNAPCGSSDDLVQVTVNATSNAGTAGPNRTVCAGTNSGTITLSGYTGMIVRWESSTDPTFNPATPITNTTAVQSFANLTQTTYYRAVVKSGNCAESFSNGASVTVNPITVANAGPSQNLCGVTTATVNGNQPTSGTGTWSFVSGPQGATPSITTNGTTGNITGLTVGGVYTFRWTINNPPCPVSSATTTVTVSPLTVGGSVSSDQTICGGVNTGTLVLTGHIGNVVRWESSNNNFNGNTIIHQNPTAQHTYVNLTETTWYRAIVQSGSCAQEISTPVKITVVPPTTIANAGSNQTICTSSTTLTGNVPNSGTSSWTFVVGPATPTVVTNNNVATVTGMMVPGNYIFRYTITNPPCAPSSANVQVTVQNPINTGTIAAPATVCAVNNSGTLTLTGNGGQVVRWEVSTDGFTWSPIGNTSNTQTYSGLTQNTWYRAAINGGICGTVFTNPVMITVNAPAVAGTLLGEATVCSGNNAGQIQLSGHSGTIVRWEQSTNGGQTWTNLVNTTPTQLYNNLTQTTAFRAVIQSGVCPLEFTAPVVITMAPATNAGMVMNNMTVCSGTNTGTLTLSGHNGTVVRWESSTDGITWNPIANQSTSQVFAGLTQTTLFRAVVQAGSCPSANSTPAIVTVVAGTVAGNLSAPATVCAGTNNGTLNLTGNVGLVVRWEVSTDGGNTFTTINNQTNTFTYNNLTVSSIYRVFVQNAGCNGAYSNPVTITVEGGAQAGTVNGSTTFCGQVNSGTLTLVGNGGTIVRWESSTDNFVTITTINNNTATQTFTNLTVTTQFRAVVTSQLCGGQANSQPATVTIVNNSQPGIITGNTAGCTNVSGVLTLTGHVGNVVRWEVSTDNVNFTTTPGNMTTLAYNTGQTLFYRAVVQSGNCPEATTPSVQVQVSQPSVGGTVSSNATVCSGSNSGALTLNGNVGNIVRWEFSTDGGQTWSPINNNTNVQNYSGLTQTTVYRAVVQNGSCPPAFSSTATITITGNLTMNAQPVVGCNGIGSIYALASGGVGPYSYSINPPVAPSNDDGRFNSLPSGNYTVSVTDGAGCTVAIQVFVPATPTAPVITSVTNITLTSAVVSWPPIQGTGVVYTLRYRILGSQTWTTISNITGTSQFLSGLQNNTTYEIQLAYRCGAQSPLSPFSEGLVTQFTTLSMGTCNNDPVPVPGGFFVDQITNTSFRANWNIVPLSAGTIIAYGPTSQNPNSWTQLIVCNPTNSLVISGLTPNTSYGVRIRTNCSNCITALNNNDRRSAFSSIINFNTPGTRDVAMEQTVAGSDVVIYPNPNNGFFNVSFDATTAENLQLVLTDVTGRVLFTRNYTATVGNNEIPFELSGYASGVYMLRVQRGNSVQTTKIVVE